MNGIIPIVQIGTDITSALSTNDLEKIATQDYRQMSAYLIGKIPAQALLSTEEQHIFHTEQQQAVTAQPVAAKKLVVVLKATRLCNLRCTYCHSWAEGPNQTMRFDILVRTIRKILAIPNIKRLSLFGTVAK